MAEAASPRAKGGTPGKKFDMRVDSEVYATMRDGTRIALRIYRPDAPGQYPALFAASPYMYATDDLPNSRQVLWRECGPVPGYVETHGYADVHADVRKKLTGHKADDIHARYTHHDEALSRAMENLPGVGEKGSFIGKSE